MDTTRSPLGSPRYFSLDEAESLVPRVRDLVQTMQARAEELRRLQEQVGEFGARKRQHGHAEDGEARLVQQMLGRAQVLVGALRDLAREVDEIGCELKDVQQGLVDFRSLREGREVYLCWRLGEDHIAFWHELDTGFAGRRPL